MILPLRLSTILAGPRTADARDIDDARREMQDLGRDVMAKRGACSVEVFSCVRHGGCVVDVLEAS